MENVKTKHIPYGPYEKYIKRPLDILCGLAAVVVFWWLYLILIVLGAIFMRGNPFFTQERPGKDGKIFKLIKFRTMDNRRDKDGNLLPDEVRLNQVRSAAAKDQSGRTAGSVQYHQRRHERNWAETVVGKIPALLHRGRKSSA